MGAHDTPFANLTQQLNTNADTGLSADQAREALLSSGPNKLEGKKKKTLLRRFFEQFKDVMIIILLIAAAVSFVVALRGHDWAEFFEPLLILLIVVLNAIMGLVQESKAERALEALKNLSAPHARVRRDGREQMIDAADIVPGDVVLLEAGDFVPADARLIESSNLKAEESALTGESVPVEKDAAAQTKADAPLGDRFNMVYSGCSITYGRASALVTATGMNTEMGKIARLITEEQDGETPLQKKLAHMGKLLGIMALVICAAIFAMGWIFGIPLLEMFMTAVSLAVSAIPEGLPAIVTIVLSIGVTRMAKKNAIIRNMPAVETLGSASVICSDKTGTLTQNRMTLVKAYDAESGVLEDITNACSDPVKKLLMYATLCSNGSVSIGKDGKVTHLGDPTETCIVLAAQQNGMEKGALSAQYARLHELPFDSERKLMSVVCDIDGQLCVITKGAFDSFVGRVSHGDMDEAKKRVEELGGQALRVLAVGCKRIDALPQNPSFEQIESDLTLMGLVCMIDPPRPEVRDAVAECKKAGIKAVMITGDHVLTASAIARDLGISEQGDKAFTGAELSALSEAQLDQVVAHTSVYARVSPEDKIRVVKAWQRRGSVVAMTGDGVNDAPALKAADIGCAMGITGTDVSKGAADMILTDDNFTTIVSAVKEGRGIFDNIKKTVCFLLSTNIGEVLTVFFAMLLFRESPLLSMQLLWINLVTDSLPAIALGMEAVEPEVMTRKPRPKDESLFAHGQGARIAMQGALFALLTLGAYWLGKAQAGGIEGGRTMAFMVLSLTQLSHAFNMRSDHSLFQVGFFGNRSMNLSVLTSLVLTMLVLLLPPLTVIFGLVALPGHLYLIGLLLALAPLPVLEIAKAVGVVRVRHHEQA